MDNLILDWTCPSGTRWGTWKMNGRSLELQADGANGWLAASPAGLWSIRRVGFNRPRTVVRPTGMLAELARVESGWDGHDRLEIVSGPTWDLDSTHPGRVILRDQEGNALVTVSAPACWDATGARVEVRADFVDDRFVTLAILLASFTFLSRHEEPGQTVVRGLIKGRAVRSWFS